MATNQCMAPQGDTIIIDCGSSQCKAGFAGDSSERISIPTVVGRPKQQYGAGGTCPDVTYIGEEARMRKVILDIKSPMHRGVVTNWDDMEMLFDYIFTNGLGVDIDSQNIVLTEPLFNPIKNREKLIELMFERFNVNSFYLASAAPMALHAYGFNTGVVLDSGAEQTHIVPVYEGLPIINSSRFIPLGGKDINKMLETLLVTNNKEQRILRATGASEKEFLQQLKEKHCYVALNYEEELANSAQAQKTFRLPDGNSIRLDNELFLSTEVLFDPEMMEVKTGGIHDNIYRAIQLSDPALKGLLYSHVVLSGGNTLFNGLRERLSQEMRDMPEPGYKIIIFARPDRKNAVFRGASMMSTLPTFQARMVTQPEFFDLGPSIVNRKCF